MKSMDEILGVGAYPIQVLDHGNDGFAAHVHLSGTMEFTMIASWGMGWDHVSLSLKNRCPTWDEMCRVKDLCFWDYECVMQLHPSKVDYVNHHPYCLHLWRPHDAEIPRPPSIMVGPKTEPAK